MPADIYPFKLNRKPNEPNQEDETVMLFIDGKLVNEKTDYVIDINRKGIKVTWYIANPPRPAPGPSLSQRIWNILLEDGQSIEWQHDEIKKLFTLRNLIRERVHSMKLRFRQSRFFKKNLPRKRA